MWESELSRLHLTLSKKWARHSTGGSEASSVSMWWQACAKALRCKKISLPLFLSEASLPGLLPLSSLNLPLLRWKSVWQLELLEEQKLRVYTSYRELTRQWT